VLENASENLKYGDLAMESPVGLTYPGKLQEVLMASYGNILVNCWWASVRNTKMVIADIQQVPQPRSFDVFYVTRNGFSKALMEIQFGTNANGMT
jgi:hypothetical protein